MAAQESFEAGSKDLLFYAGVHVGLQVIARMAQLVSGLARGHFARHVDGPARRAITGE